MILTMLRVMLLGLIRDRSALVMAFVLPPLIYLIFAAIFSGTTGDALRLRVAVFDNAKTPVTERLASAIRAEPTFRAVSALPKTINELETMLRRAEIDVGVIIRRDPAQATTSATPPIQILGDEARAMAGPIVAGQVQRLFSEKLTDVAYRRSVGDIEHRLVKLSPQQKAQIDAVLSEVEKRLTSSDKERSTASTQDAESARLIEQINLPTHSTAGATVTYYAGAVGILFLLFSSFQGAMSLIDERQSGIINRLLAGGGSASTVVFGKFLYLTLQGALQLSLIFLVAYLAYSVDFTARWLDWTLITFAASATAAGIALFVGTLCSTRQQLQTLTNSLVLVVSALGGSMVPRFLMPPWLQDVSWIMPNAWAIEAYQALLWRNEPSTELVTPILMLLGVATVTVLLACGTMSARRLN